MKTKSVLKRIIFFVWVVTLLAGFTACSSEEDNGLYVVTYSAGGTLSATGFDNTLVTLKVIADYNTTIGQVMGGSFCTADKDKEIIEACDKIFEKHKTQYTNAKGLVNIEKTIGTTSSPDEELPSTTLKTYKYE